MNERPRESGAFFVLINQRFINAATKSETSPNGDEMVGDNTDHGEKIYFWKKKTIMSDISLTESSLKIKIESLNSVLNELVRCFNLHREGHYLQRQCSTILQNRIYSLVLEYIIDAYETEYSINSLSYKGNSLCYIAEKNFEPGPLKLILKESLTTLNKGTIKTEKDLKQFVLTIEKKIRLAEHEEAIELNLS